MDKQYYISDMKYFCLSDTAAFIMSQTSSPHHSPETVLIHGLNFAGKLHINLRGI